MAALVIPNCLQVAISGTQADGPWAIVNHWDIEAASTSAEGTAQSVLDEFVDQVLTHLTNTVTVSKAHYIDLSTATGPTGDVTYSGTGSTTGGVGVAPSPPQVAYLMRLNTGGARGTRPGRIYLPGVRSDEVSNSGDVTSGTVTTMGAAVNTWRNNVESDTDCSMCVAHRSGASAGTFSIVSSVVCEVPIATQRRRLRRS